MLLTHVRGARSYEDIRTVNGRLCSTFREACAERDLLKVREQTTQRTMAHQLTAHTSAQ